MALEAIQGAKKINPKLILDLFYEHVYKDLSVPISNEDDVKVVDYAKKKISGQFNEMSPALMIFDKHWSTMTLENQKAIWKYLKVLCMLCDKARQTRIGF